MFLLAAGAGAPGATSWGGVEGETEAGLGREMEQTGKGAVWGGSPEEVSLEKEALGCGRTWACEQRLWEIEKEVLGMLSSASGWGGVGAAVGWRRGRLPAPRVGGPAQA